MLDIFSPIMVPLSGSEVPWKVLGTSFLIYRVWEKSHFTNIVPDFIFLIISSIIAFLNYQGVWFEAVQFWGVLEPHGMKRLQFACMKKFCTFSKIF